jgi:hypothetical protein
MQILQSKLVKVAISNAVFRGREDLFRENDG